MAPMTLQAVPRPTPPRHPIDEAVGRIIERADSVFEGMSAIDSYGAMQRLREHFESRMESMRLSGFVQADV